MKRYLPMDFAKALKLRFRVGDLDPPEKRKISTSNREELEADAQMFPCCGKAILAWKNVKCRSLYYEISGGHRRRSRKGIRLAKTLYIRNVYNVWKQRNERPTVGGVSIRSRNVAPSRKGCVVNGQMTT